MVGTTYLNRDDVTLAVTDVGGDGATVLLLHGLAGSSRELLPTAKALDGYRVLLFDQRGHGGSTRRPQDLSRKAFVDDVICVLEHFAPGEQSILVGQSMGAHTAFLTAAARPDLVSGLVMLEGHAAGNDNPQEAADVGKYFASWPIPFSDECQARNFLGTDAIVDAWVADFEQSVRGLVPRFDSDIMELVIAAVHEPRWEEWSSLRVPTLAVFAESGMFSELEKEDLIRRRPETSRVDLAGGSHDAHLDAPQLWIEALSRWLNEQTQIGR